MAAGAASYTIDMRGEQPIRTARGDKAGRGPASAAECMCVIVGGQGKIS